MAQNTNPKTPGQIAFEAYDAHGPNAGKDYRGEPTRPWPAMEQATREKWEAGIEGAVPPVEALESFLQQRGAAAPRELAEELRRFILTPSAWSEPQTLGVPQDPPEPPKK